MSLQANSFLVTGGAGFIGSHIVDELLARGKEVWILDNLSNSKLDNISHHKGNRTIKLVVGDIRDTKLVDKIVAQVEIVLHEAAIASLPYFHTNALEGNDVNVSGTVNLLEASRRNNVRRFIFASSSSVYGEPDSVPISEDTRLSPISPYGASKLSAETYCKAYYETYGLKTTSLRYFNVYGPRQAANSYSGVISKFVDDALNNRQPTIYGDGHQFRDFISVFDVIRANMIVLERDEAVGQIFNIGSGKAVNIIDLAKIVLRVTKRENTSPIIADPRPGDIRRSVADISRSHRVLGYNPQEDLESRLESFVQWRVSRLQV